MTKQLLVTIILAMSIPMFIYGQSNEELEAQKAEKTTQLKELESQVEALKGEIAGIDAQLVVFPRWETGALGILGLDFNSYTDWLARDQPNTTASNIGISGNLFANYFTEKGFWRNTLNTNFGWVKFDDKDNPDDNPEFQETADVLNISSLYGFKLNDKIAVSLLGEYRSTILSNFNNPGFLDIGAGITWTPITNLVVVAHPVNYNFVFSNSDFEFNSSLGAKIVADYANEIAKGVKWRSNLSLFMSYEDLNELSNWTWVNGVGFNVWKGIGVGFELGLRSNKQEALAREITDNPLQTYWTLGLSYSI